MLNMRNLSSWQRNYVMLCPTDFGTLSKLALVFHQAFSLHQALEAGVLALPIAT